MVVDTAYYDILEIQPTASDLEVKKAYRKLAIKLHPDKNPDDEAANAKFQAIGEAYQVLSDPQLRAAYDKYGKESAVPASGFDDPAEFFSMIFGGDAFKDWIGEISLMKDLTKTMEISMAGNEEEEAQAQAHTETAPPPATEATTTAAASEEPVAGAQQTSTHPDGPPLPPRQAEAAASTPAGTAPAPAPAAPATESNPYSQERPKGIPLRPALEYSTAEAHDSARLSAAGATEGEKELRKEAKKKGGLTKEQREELAAYEQERRLVREERINTLAQKLVDRVSVWTETDKGADVTAAFKEKTRLEIENLKMESFGLEILHTIGNIYVSKATGLLKSHKLFGLSGFWSRLKEKGSMAKETWGTISTAIDAQLSLEEMAKAEEKGGEEWDERKAELEKKVTGKILAAAWRGSRFEIQGVLRDTCDRVLNVKTVPLEKRVERAEAMIILGDMLKKAQRDPDEEGDFLVFEQLVAEAQAKKSKDERKKKHKTASASGQEKQETQQTPEQHATPPQPHHS